MAFIILQLGDIHFSAKSDRVRSRATAIKDAVVSTFPRIEGCIIAIPGDIANTGSSDEYEVAFAFLEELRSALLAARVTEVEFALVPGNHDCNLRKQSDTRTFIFENLRSFLSKPLDFDGANYRAITAVQADFFEFEAILRSRDLTPPSEQLYYVRSFAFGARVVHFHCFNTAWLSRRNEVQAELFIPQELLVPPSTGSADLSIAMLHHPFNWLDANNVRAVSDFIAANADIVLTGHEHVAGASRRQFLEGQTVDFIEAGCLQEVGMEESTFNVLAIDFDSAAQRIMRFSFERGLYAKVHDREWALARNDGRTRSTLRNTDVFMAELRSVGTGFRHPRCTPPSCTLSLRDFFVYPDLRHQTLDKVICGESPTRETITGENICSFVEQNHMVLLYGADDSGKSSLLKILYEDLSSRGYAPLLVRGEELRGKSTDEAVIEVVRAAAANQYSPACAEAYMQLGQNKRFVLLDDVHKLKSNKATVKRAVDVLQCMFLGVVATASDLYALQQLTYSTDDSVFGTFERCDIKEFGRYHRQRLIEKWHYLGRETTSEPAELSRKVILTDKTISTVMGKNVLPHYPVTILTLLQLLEANEIPNTANGSYGYLYEVLIKTALAGARGPSHDVDLKVTYLSRVAFAMYRVKGASLPESEIRDVHNSYCSTYDMIRDFGEMMSELQSAEVLVFARGSYRFKYPYMLYYFIAKYFQENARYLQSNLHEVADHLYNDTNANALIFYVYLTKDAELIQHLVDDARRIYDEYPVCDFASHVDYINNLFGTQPPPLVLPSADVVSNRNEANRRYDQAIEEQSETSQELDVKYDRQLNDVLKVNIAFKTLGILGQVLRNFTGSLEGPLKLDITRECYALGMRTLSALLALAAENIEDLRQYIGQLIAERTGVSDKQLAELTDRAIIWLTLVAGYGSVKRISYAVGHEDLTATYSKVLSGNSDLGTRIIDVAIKLDHYEAPPETDLRRLKKEVRNNFFAYTILRDLVADFLYLYSTDYPTMQALGDMWDIKVSAPKYLLNRSKKGIAKRLES